jgi:hypothetical protein
MAGERIVVGVAYRTGADGATVRFLGGDVATLPPGRLCEFGQSGQVEQGLLEAAPDVGRRRKLRVGYPDKARLPGRDYAHKGR